MQNVPSIKNRPIWTGFVTHAKNNTIPPRKMPSRLFTNHSLEAIQIVACSHGNSQQLLKSLRGRGELHPDLAGTQRDAFREISQFLIYDACRSLNEKPCFFLPSLLKAGH